HVLFDKPDGVNINMGCGSTHIEKLQDYVVKNNLDGGLAFDGDADRCLAVDEKGQLVDGDFIIAIIAADFKSQGKLKKNAVVGTVMTNMGFNRFCDDNGMKFISTKVGDRYVLEAMVREGYNIGGEQSGHVIMLDYSTTGDGELTGATLMSLINRRKAKLSSIATLMERYPQVLINVKVSNSGKLSFYTDKEVKKEISRITDILGDKGRILVRASGTEPLVRVMLEGENLEEITRLANEAAEVVRERLS
ncbi:MAG: phosphoglucosamine mutase, partial [Ruminococcus sp.]